MAVVQQISTRTVRTPANAVTSLRIMLSPVVVFAIYQYAPAWWVLIFGFLSMITDRVDGMLARRYGISKLGIFLDPLADKIIVLGSLIALIARGWVWWFPVVLIAAREIAMSWWRSYYARKGVSVSARPLAKIKTWSQSITVAAAITPGIVAHHGWALNGFLWLSVVLTLFTFAQYIFDGRPSISTTATAK